jgi:hypothetical protein
MQETQKNQIVRPFIHLTSKQENAVVSLAIPNPIAPHSLVAAINYQKKTHKIPNRYMAR